VRDAISYQFDVSNCTQLGIDIAQLDSDTVQLDTADWWQWSQHSSPDNSLVVQQEHCSSLGAEQPASPQSGNGIEELDRRIIGLEGKMAKLDELEHRCRQLDEAEQRLGRIEEIYHRLCQLELTVESHYAQFVSSA
jgi:hypothetical protein